MDAASRCALAPALALGWRASCHGPVRSALCPLRASVSGVGEWVCVSVSVSVGTRVWRAQQEEWQSESAAPSRLQPEGLGPALNSSGASIAFEVSKPGAARQPSGSGHTHPRPAASSQLPATQRPRSKHAGADPAALGVPDARPKIRVCGIATGRHSARLPFRCCSRPALDASRGAPLCAAHSEPSEEADLTTGMACEREAPSQRPAAPGRHSSRLEVLLCGPSCVLSHAHSA